MDGICDSVRTEEEARELTKCTDNVLETGDFKGKGWLSKKAKESNTDQEERKEATILNNTSEEKVLGVAWNTHADVFTFKVQSELLHCQEPKLLSKRKILSQVARIYDPIGFASAFLIRAKTGLQELWKKGTQDEMVDLFVFMKK